MPSTLPNGHQSPLTTDVHGIDENASIPNYDNQSDVSEASPDEEDASDEDADHDQSGDAESDAAEEFDAEMSSDSSDNENDLNGQASPATEDHIGEDDGDSAMEGTSDAHLASISGNSSINGPRRGTKRKSPVVEDEFIRSNPSLYGLRRSSRARPNRQNIQTTSDSESDAVAPAPKRRRRTPVHSSKPSLSQSIPSQSDSESDEYQVRNRTSKTKRRRTAQSSDNLIPAHAEVRFSTRRANRVSNYNEDDDDHEFEDESEMMTPAEWTNTVDESIPAIDIVLNHRFKDGVDITRPDLDRNDCEFYIKWQGKSHYHATWETAETLAGCRSVRRLDNYIRKVLALALQYMRDRDIAPEEKEKWNLDRERDVDAIEDYKQAERVIGSRKVDGETEYYVKWKRLFYDCCTWEPASLVSEIAQKEIDRYLDRCSHPPISSKTEANPASRASFEPIHGTPSYVQNGQLKEFQVKGVNFMAYNWVRGRNVVLADEMGLGKTVQTVAFINWLRHVRNQQGPFIVVVPLSTMPSWAETFDNWTPDLNYVVYNGNETSRNIIKEYELLIDGSVRRPKFHVLLTTYEYVLVDATFLSQIKWQFLAVDEAHRLKNRDSQLYSKLVEFRSPSRLLITGTPVQNNLGELSALMDFLNPGLIQIDEDMDLSSEAASVKLAELTKAIQPYMLRRTKSKVESDLPPKSEKIIRVELSDVQLEYYKNILTKNYAALNQGSKGQKQSLLNIMMELKKASNHPFMFPNAESRILEGKSGREEMMRALITSSGKMMLLDQLLAKLKRDGHRVLIFSQMVRMLDILADYMDVRGYAYQRLDGTIAAGPRRLSIEHFNEADSNDFAFLLSTRAGGLGINLMTADTVVLFDSDWNPQADLQAMARAHRIGQTRPVSVYRLVSKDTVEEEVLERARNKLLLEFITIQRGVTDKEATEIKDKMARAGHSIAEPTSSDDISRILKRRGQRMFEQSGNQKKLEELDIDSVLENAEEHKTEQAESMEADGGEEFLKAFEFVDVKVDELTWDEIIPKEELEQIKAEEERQAHEQFLAQEIERSQGRKRKEPLDGRQERQAKRRAREQVNIDADDVSDAPPPPDPSRPLNEKECRHLIRAYLRYGDFDDRQEDIIREARLIGRDITVVKAALDDVLEKARGLLKEENNRLNALEREGKSFTKKERKAILFDHLGVKRLNAETLIERPNEMRVLRNITADVADPKSFRVPEATKGADYTCPWGAREDGMLCVGIARHGYGAWTQIRDDPDLALSDKFFLEEHRVDKKAERMNGGGKGTTKSPGAVHLVRRADYLLSVLKDKMSNGASVTAKRAVDNHHRNNRKNNSRGQTSVSASPSPSLSRKPRDSEKARSRVHHKSRDNIDLQSAPDGHKLSRGSDKARMKSRDEKDRHRRSNDHASSSIGSDDNMLKVIFKPIREHLKSVSQVTKENIPSKSERAGELRRLLCLIGEFIRSTLKGKEAPASLEERLWGYAATYWPNKGTPASALLNMFDRLAAAGEGRSSQQQ
ncbi:hypothetical protein AJ79_02334 [Helicocarpus griseus UAMH5409]|uniref:Chromodomain-helicase-DNA-binding protein 1 n=1 Tax=Helicocarpus griseus UAMH5409 TaxID=1447875 RepID=A0A2B7Y3Y1_9EURO|nr:hypothetical protein AJ79_02334 [Helicocarpus griseus UAMH5409]